MPVAPTIFDPNASPTLTAVSKICLPWMTEETNSPGPGDCDTIGSRDGQTMGDGPRDGPGGLGEAQSRYRGVGTLHSFAHCPDPQCSANARGATIPRRVVLQ